MGGGRPCIRPPDRCLTAYTHCRHCSSCRLEHSGSSIRPSPYCRCPPHGTGRAPCRLPGWPLCTCPPDRCLTACRHCHRCSPCRWSHSESSICPSPHCRCPPHDIGQTPYIPPRCCP